MHSFAWWPTLIVVTIATITDLYSRRIPNWLVLPFLLLGVGVSTSLYGWHGLGESAAGIALGLAVFGVFFWLGGMGAGDVKLCASVGAWVGPHQLSIALILTALAGGLLVLVWAISGGFLGELFDGTGDLVMGWRKRGKPVDVISPPMRRKIPYAPAIAVGTVLSFFAH